MTASRAMRATHTLEFSRAPGLWAAYRRAVLARKPRLVPAGATVPRIEARLARVTVDQRHLTRYAALCGAAAADSLPIAYPHVLAAPVHLAMLAGNAFPVRLLGLVHLRNRITLRQPLPPDAPATMLSSIEGHRDTERGQEFDLRTEYVVDGEVLWVETCTFLARGRSGGETAPTPRLETASASLVEAAPAASASLRTSTFDAPAGLGRRYAVASGDFNPIHLGDLAARVFGFRRAIAHGMWTLARTASELGAGGVACPCEFTVSFRRPVALPSRLTLEQWPVAGGTEFAVRDAQGERPNLTGALMHGASATP
jgi:acyl dehydratase